jgi:hypothetical protein
MKIIKKIDDNTVVFAGKKLSIDANGCYGEGWEYKTNTSNLILETGVTLPRGFVAGGWSHLDGVWVSNAIGDAYLAERDAEIAAATRKSGLESEVKGDSDLATLRSMSNSEINDWFDLNVTNLNQCIRLLKKVVKSLARKDIL